MDDAVGAPAAVSVAEDVVIDTMLALSGGRCNPDIVVNAWCVVTPPGAIAKSK